MNLNMNPQDVEQRAYSYTYGDKLFVCAHTIEYKKTIKESVTPWGEQHLANCMLPEQERYRMKYLQCDSIIATFVSLSFTFELDKERNKPKSIVSLKVGKLPMDFQSSGSWARLSRRNVEAAKLILQHIASISKKRLSAVLESTYFKFHSAIINEGAEVESRNVMDLEVWIENKWVNVIQYVQELSQ